MADPEESRWTENMSSALHIDEPSYNVFLLLPIVRAWLVVSTVTWSNSLPNSAKSNNPHGVIAISIFDIMTWNMRHVLCSAQG